MQAAIDRLVATTFAAFSDALAKASLSAVPLARTRAVDRAIEALTGYALGVFAAGLASRLSSGADLDRATQIRAALFRSTSAACLVTPPVALDLDALLDEHPLVTPGDLRMRVAVRLRECRDDATRVVAALVEAAATATPDILDELARGDLAATRFGEQVERVWALLHGGTTYVAPPKVAKPEYCVTAIR